jgi:hypothetical protein
MEAGLTSGTHASHRRFLRHSWQYYPEWEDGKAWIYIVSSELRFCRASWATPSADELLSVDGDVLLILPRFRLA